MNLIDKYKKLPDAHRIPDEVWSTQKLLDEIAEIDRRHAELIHELTWVAAPAMMAVLRRDWTETELKEAGLMS